MYTVVLCRHVMIKIFLMMSMMIDHRMKMIMTIMMIKLNMVIMMINIRCVHLALMISLCFSSIINAMYLVALDTIIIILNLE